MKERVIKELRKRMELESIFKAHRTDIQMKKDGKWFEIDFNIFKGLKNTFLIIELDDEGEDYIQCIKKDLTIEEVAEWLIAY